MSTNIGHHQQNNHPANKYRAQPTNIGQLTNKYRASVGPHLGQTRAIKPQQFPKKITLKIVAPYYGITQP